MMGDSNQISKPPTSLDPGLLLAGLLALFVILPLLQPGLPGTADTPIHFYRTLEFARSWGPGVIYPRWAPDLAYGYGYPLWNFVPPLPYLIPLAFYAAGLSLEASLKILMALTALGYALGAYLFARQDLGPQGGLVAAAIYTLAPFALREALLYGGNYPQYLAIGLYPWTLWALRRVKSRPDRLLNILLVALFYGAAILSHLFHALILTGVAIAYAGLLWGGDRRQIRRLGASALGLALGLLGTAFFWSPALIERAFTRAVEDVFVSISPFYLRFLDWHELLAWPRALDGRAANPWVPFSLGPAALTLAGLGILALVLRRRVNGLTGQRGNESASWRVSAFAQQQGLFFLGLLALCVFMVLPASNWVWSNAPFLALAEFPWRWLGLANLSLAFLGGASATCWFSPPRRTALALGGTLALLLASAVYLYPFRPFVRYGATAPDMMGYESASGAVGTTTLGEYLPRWVKSTPDTPPPAEALRQGDAVEKLDRASLPGGATARALDRTPVSVVYHFDSPRPFQARFFTFYFPGWRAYIDGQPVEISIEPGSGLITVPMPAGSHQLRLGFGDTPLRRASNAVSGAALVVLIAAGLVRSLGMVSKKLGGQGIRDRESGNQETHSPACPIPDPPIPQPSGVRAGWPWRRALIVGGVLVGSLLLKALVVDPYTEWFRRQSPPDRVGGVGHPLRVNLDERFWLLGYDLERERAAQGSRLRVVLYWQARRPIATNYRSFIHLDSPVDGRTWAGSDNYHPGDVTAQIELPTATWDTAHYVRDEHILLIPPDAPPVTFDLRAGLYNPDTGERLPIAGGGNTIRLGALQVTPGRGLRPAALPNRVDYRLGEHIQLLGYDWNPSGEDPGGATLTLYWGRDKRTPADSPQAEADYVVFVHLLDGQGRLAWGADGPPLGGLYPTSAWRSGGIVADPRPLELTGLTPGRYTLAVGMYHPDTLVRLPVFDARGRPLPADAIPLTQLTWP